MEKNLIYKSISFNFLMVESNLCFKFCNFIMKLFHLLRFTKELIFGSSTSVTRLNSFFDGSHFFKEQAGIVCHAFEAFSVEL